MQLYVDIGKDMESQLEVKDFYMITEKLNTDTDQRIEVVIEELEGECPF